MHWISTVSLISNFVLKFLLIRRFIHFHSNCIILFNIIMWSQIVTFYRFDICTEISTFWSIHNSGFKFKPFSWFILFHSNCNILINLPILQWNSTLWSIPNFQKFASFFQRGKTAGFSRFFPLGRNRFFH